MTCRATRRDRLLVSRGVHPHYRATLETYAEGAGLDRGRGPARRRGPAGRHHGPRGPRAPARRCRPARSRASSRRSPTSWGCWRTMPEIGRLAHAAGALFVSVIEPVSLAVLAPPGEPTAPISRAGEGQPLGIPLGYGGPYLGHRRLHGRAGAPDPGPPRGHDRGPRRQARLRDDDARPRAGHPAREGRQQHLHQPGAARPRGLRVPLGHRPPRAARRRGARVPRAPPSSRRPSAAAGAPRLHAGPYLNEFVVRVPGRAGRPRPPPGAGRPGGHRHRGPPARRARPSRTGSSCAPRRSRRRPRSSGSPAALAAELAGAGRRGCAHERRRRAAPAHDLRAQPARARRWQDPAPAQGRAGPDPGRRAARGAAGAARARGARGRPPLREPVPAQLLGRHGLLPAGLVHHEVQPQAQRVGRAPAGLRQPPPAGARRGRPGHAPAALGARGASWPRSAAWTPSRSSPPPAPTAS